MLSRLRQSASALFIRTIFIIVCVCVSCHQPWRLHEHRNISVPLWSSQQTEPADAGQWDAGWSFWSTLLTSVCLRGTITGGHMKDLTILVFVHVFNRNSFLTQFQSIFDGDLYFSGCFLIFFFLPCVWCSNFMPCVHCSVQPTLYVQHNCQEYVVLWWRVSQSSALYIQMFNRHLGWWT